jgi:hypothetical protein
VNPSILIWSRISMKAMRNLEISLAILLAVACTDYSQITYWDPVNELTYRERTEGWKLLFDGLTLDGWELMSPGSWTVEEGTLALAEEAGMGAEGMIWTGAQYGDFIFQCEFRIDPGTNSGVFFRVGDRSDPVQTGFEMQINDSFSRPEHRRGPTHNCGALYDIVAPSHNMAKPPGEWNHAVITCRDNIISISLNADQVVSTVDLDQYVEPNRNIDGTENKFNRPLKDFPRLGYIGFQQHGGRVWFRNIKVKEL